MVACSRVDPDSAVTANAPFLASIVRAIDPSAPSAASCAVSTSTARRQVRRGGGVSARVLGEPAGHFPGQRVVRRVRGDREPQIRVARRVCHPTILSEMTGAHPRPQRTRAASERNAAEQAARRAAVRVDLRAQRVHVGKRALVAQALHEREPQAGVVEIARRRRAGASRPGSRSTSPKVGRVPMFVTDGCSMPSTAAVVA